MAEHLFFGKVPVPYTVSWSGEEGMHVAPCRHAAGRRAICQGVARGEGRPLFGKPHAQRQREVIAEGLCDLCGNSLRNRTKVSLSHARPRANGATGLNILQVEPLLHKECAQISVRHCPSLRRDIRAGSLNIRIVTRHQAQFAIMDEIYTKQVAGAAVRAIGHAKVELLAWKDQTIEWLLGQPLPPEGASSIAEISNEH
ncbi:hypothetical protein [Azorhizobium doebereinerae]|uniref:hypothetical protein n=1 Tax=Azorhizobium doebereinerae TaxID=281091 RepID=UPI0004022E2B|nr:hypothetical protein [Azorhizobium doebereinerae]